MNRRISKKLRWALLAPLLAVACAGYIMPRPSFYWPDMAQSKITGKGVFVVSKNVSSKVVEVGAELSPPAKKQVLLGKGIRQLLADVGNTVFEKSEIYDGIRPQTGKSKGLRCLLRLEEADCRMRTLQSSEGAPVIQCAVSIKVVFEDYAVGRIGSRVIELSGLSSIARAGNDKKLDSEIKKAVGESLNDLGRKLAAEIVNAYGARM